MTKAVFTTKVTPSYNDLPEVRYHFPRTYLNQAKQAVGDHIVYYEPRRSSVELSSFGGRQSYFGVARVTAVVEDDKLADHYYALVDDYLDFDRPVPFSEGGEYYETALKKEDGSTNKGAFGRAVRLIPDDEFDRILKSGFAPILSENLASREVPLPGFSEPPTPFERPIVEMTVSRPFRERSFMHNVRAAYSNRCAITGLRLINGGVVQKFRRLTFSQWRQKVPILFAADWPYRGPCIGCLIGGSSRLPTITKSSLPSIMFQTMPFVF
jgi:putative restriction endonuclease